MSHGLAAYILPLLDRIFFKTLNKSMPSPENVSLASYLRKCYNEAIAALGGTPWLEWLGF